MSPWDRFDFDAKKHFDAEQYIIGRARQLLEHRVMITGIKRSRYGVRATFDLNGMPYQAFYILKQHRGMGEFKVQLASHPDIPIVTLDACRMEPWLVKNAVPHICLRSQDSAEYKKIERHYGRKRADRSNALFMNHIDEGLAVLQWIGASRAAKNAYCIHPIVQMDDDLSTSWDCREWMTPDRNWTGCSAESVLLAMEYRSVANEYLSARLVLDPKDIRLSPIPEVNEMLIADKVQNRKDFELHHEATHPRSKELAHYFRMWLQRLGVEEEQYQQWKQWLSMPDKFEQSLDSEDYGK